MIDMKMSRITFLFLFMGLFLMNCKDDTGKNPNSQSPITFFNETGTEKVFNVINLNDGGFLYVGTANNRAFAMKVDAHGDRAWYKTIGGIQGAQFKAAVETSDGKLICVGLTLSDPGSLDREAGLVVKFSANGEIEWNKVFSGPYEQLLYAVMISPDGYIITTGGVVPSDVDTWLLKLTMQGEEVWSTDYTYLSDWHDWGASLVMSPDGDYVIAGLTSPDATSLNNRKFDAYVIAINPDDAELTWGWAYRQFPAVQGPGEHGDPQVIGLDDGYVWAKGQYDADTVFYIQLLKIDLAGNELFNNSYYGLGTASFQNIQQTDDGGFLINGASKTLTESSATGQTMLLKTDASGNEEWTSYSGGKPNFEESYQSNTNGTTWKHAGSSHNSKGVSSLTYFKTNDQGKINE
jgi:hypothetical protein